ncbi:hypothetical protein D3C75_663270 [compost metagenome]
MSVSLVTAEAAFQPDYRLCSGVLADIILNLFAAKLGIAVSVKQALLRGNQCSFSIGMNRSALHDQRRIKPVNLQLLQNLRGHLIIEVPRHIFPAPGIELPVHTGELPVPSRNKRRPVITQPGIIMPDRQKRYIGSKAQSLHRCQFFRIYYNCYWLKLGNRLYNLSIAFTYCFIVIRKYHRRLHRPGDEGPFMLVPFRRHCIVQIFRIHSLATSAD